MFGGSGDGLEDWLVGKPHPTLHRARSCLVHGRGVVMGQEVGGEGGHTLSRVDGASSRQSSV